MMMGSKQELELPPGFRFHPTDEELVMHYLCRKCASLPISVPIIAEIDLYKFNPWDLPDMALYGEKEWYFFSPRDRKYPNGSRPNRAAGCGYWKATGADKPIGHPKPVAIKKALVFYAGKAPKGDKTNWIMHEYRLAGVDRSASKSANAKHRTSSLRLDDWVLCRIYNKKGSFEKQNEGKKLDMLAANSEQAVSHSHTCNMDATSDSVQPPQLHTDSTTSCSERYEHVMTPEVESEHKVKELDFDKALGFPTFGYPDAPTNLDNLFTSQLQFPACGNQMSPLQDIFMFLQKPF